MSDPNSMLLGDPVAACNTGSDFFLSSLWTTCTDLDPLSGICLAGTNGVSLSSSTDGGLTFGSPVPVVSEDLTQHVVDKDWMALDPNNAGNAFVTYSDFDISGSNSGCNNFGDILVSVQAVAFTNGAPAATLQVAQGQCNEVLQGSQVAAARDGTVYFALEKIATDGFTREIDVYKSTYSAGAFSAPIMLTSFPVQCAGDCVQLQGMIRSNEFPSLALNSAGAIMVAWNDGDNPVPDSLALFTSGAVADTYGFTDIKFAKSTDGGATWTTPVRVNTNPASANIDHFEPALAVGSGRVAVCFYDRRNDPHNFLIDRYCANSTNGGATWTNTRISARNFSSVVAQDFLLATNYMGDYDTLTTDRLGLHTGFMGSYGSNLPGYPAVKSNGF